jgi:small multidrug resistance pump
VNGYAFLAIAIASEVVATLSLRASDGLSRPPFVVLVAVGYLLAFVFLSFALGRGLPLSVAYALWAAAGVAAVAILSVPIFGDSLSLVQAGGIALVVSGVVAIELGRSAH